MEEKTTSQRLNKYLAEAGVCSRRGADALIAEGRVTVNGQGAAAGMRVTETDCVRVDGKAIRGKNEKILLAFYKPVGVVCTERDKFADKKVLDYVKGQPRVTYAGRLDKDSEGLLLLTNDGDLIQTLMRGANAHEKEYVVKIREEVTEDFLAKMGGGVYLKELDRTTRPCTAERLGKHTFRIVLTQGMNRQIRRMCETCGCHVAALKRVRVMTVTLDSLQPGESRRLTDEECAALYLSVHMPVPAQFRR